MQPEPDTPRLLDVIDIPMPCQVPWDSMTGDERIRFCGQCKKNVYNISEMGTSEAESFLQQNLGSICLGFMRRADGTIVTDTCPKILKPVRNGFRRLKRIVALILGAVMSSSSVFAQGENGCEGRQQKNQLIADWRGASPRLGVAPNVWRGESQRLPAGYGVPKQPHAMSLLELSTGDFALELDSEVYLQGGKTFISEEPKKSNTPKAPVSYTRRTGAGIEGCTASGAFRRGKEWVAKSDDRIAESYFKLALKMLTRAAPVPHSEIREMVREYADLLERNGRKGEAKKLLATDVASFRNVYSTAHGYLPSGRSMLGLDPSMLKARPTPRVKPISTSPQNVVNPFAPAVQPLTQNLGDKKQSPKLNKAEK
jgi:hypothetical protein